MFSTTSTFDKLLEKATSSLLLEPDWTTILQICDMIRQGDVQAKVVIAGIRKKLSSNNPNVILHALLVLESCVKNCGSLIHDEIATKTYMLFLKELIKTCGNDEVKNKILELMQTWAHAFRNSEKYRVVTEFVTIMKAEGFTFPVLNESDAMFSADTAPSWKDGETCHRCRTPFGLLQRKHHCRACGQVFCQQCSSKATTLPKLGFEKEVRVCEDCYEKVTKPTSTTQAQNKNEELLPAEYLNSSLALQSQTPPVKTGKTEEELKEEEELQLAIALSQSEAESNKAKSWSAANFIKQEPPNYSASVLSTSQEDSSSNPELAKYLNRSYWEQKKGDTGTPNNRVSPSATAPTSDSYSSDLSFDEKYTSSISASDQPHYNNANNISSMTTSDEVGHNTELDDFIQALKSQVEIFVNRMKSNSSRGRSIANDSSVQTLFVNITTMHSRLLKYIHEKDDKRVYYEGLQDKLTQVKDARAALNALREEHSEKLRREAEAAERQKQIMMAQKLDLMRQKKQEYLEYQRTLALQRIREQEHEMQMRQEQQKQQYLQKGFYDNPNIPSMVPDYYKPFYQPPQPHMGAPHQPQHNQPPPPRISDGQLPPSAMIPFPWETSNETKPMMNPNNNMSGAPMMNPMGGPNPGGMMPPGQPGGHMIHGGQPTQNRQPMGMIPPVGGAQNNTLPPQMGLPQQMGTQPPNMNMSQSQQRGPPPQMNTQSPMGQPIVQSLPQQGPPQMGTQPPNMNMNQSQQIGGLPSQMNPQPPMGQPIVQSLPQQGPPPQQHNISVGQTPQMNQHIGGSQHSMGSSQISFSNQQNGGGPLPQTEMKTETAELISFD